MKPKRNHYRITAVTVLFSALVGALPACQEAVNLAEEQVPDEQSQNDPVTLELPLMEVCDVIPMDFTRNRSIAVLTDGSVVVGGYLNDDTNEESVFGAGEVNETSLSADPWGPTPGFIAKYKPDNTLDWVVGGMAPVTQLKDDGDGGVTAVIDQYVEGDADNMKFIKFDAVGDEVWSLSVPYGEQAFITNADEIFVTGSFSETMTLGEGENAVTFTNTAENVPYISYVAAYASDRTLAWAVTLEDLYITNDIAVSDNAVAVVDNSGTLVYLSRDGEELWRQKVGDNGDVDPDETMIAGSFVDFGTTGVELASDDSVLWTGEFEISVIFTDDANNVVALTAPYQFTNTGGWAKVHPFVAHYTASGGLLSATDNIGFTTVLTDEDKLLTINPTKNSDPEAPLFSSVLECSDDSHLCSNFVLAQMDTAGMVETATEAVLDAEVWSGADANTLALQSSGAIWTTSRLADGLGGGSYPSSDPANPIIGNALIHICPVDAE